MPPEPVPTVLHWSGGKDSAHALGRLLDDERYHVRALLTTVHAERQENSVHGLPVALLEAQAAAVGLPLEVVELPGAGLDGYHEAMAALSVRLRDEGIGAFAFGDLDVSGALAHKQKQFCPFGLEVVEPLAGLTPAECMDAFLGTGIESLTCVVDASVLGANYLGQRLDEEFVQSLPEGCDPCGEFGEYHSVTIDAPFFAEPIGFETGEVERIERIIGTTEGPCEFAYWRLRFHAA